MKRRWLPGCFAALLAFAATAALAASDDPSYGIIAKHKANSAVRISDEGHRIVYGSPKTPVAVEAFYPPRRRRGPQWVFDTDTTSSPPFRTRCALSPTTSRPQGRRSVAGARPHLRRLPQQRQARGHRQWQEAELLAQHHLVRLDLCPAHGGCRRRDSAPETGARRRAQEARAAGKADGDPCDGAVWPGRPLR